MDMVPNSDVDSIAVLENVRKNFDFLHPAEQCVGSFLMENPDKFINMNVAEIADASGVSSATVIRFCQRLQYKSFFDLKIHLSHDIAQSQLLKRTHSSSLNSNSRDKIALIANNIFSMTQNISEEAFKNCASAIMNSHTVFVIGNGYCKILGANLIYRLTRMGYACSGGGYAEIDFENLHLGQPNDCAIFISRSGEDRKTVKELEYANKLGLITISLTDSLRSPLSQDAKYMLTTGVRQSDRIVEEFTSSDIYMHILLDVLLQYVTPRNENFDYLNDILSLDRM